VPRLYLVRHGRPTATYTDASDVGLDPIGVAQAEAVAAGLAPLGPLAIVVSPLRRARETAVPLERTWGRPGADESAVGEIPSVVTDPTARGVWLRRILQARWGELEPELQSWRRGVVDALLALRESSVVFSHYIAINVAVGTATGDDRVASFSPAHCSVTVVDTDGGSLRLLERGGEATTPVL
jgi:broad specificity phosphatase PhoE